MTTLQVIAILMTPAAGLLIAAVLYRMAREDRQKRRHPAE